MKFKSVKVLAIGAIGSNGAMGTLLQDFRGNLVSQSFNISYPKGTVIKEWVDGSDIPDIAVAGRTEGMTISFKLNDLEPATLNAFLSGSVSAAPVIFSPSAVRNSNYKSVRIKGDTIGGKQFALEIPFALVNAGIVGNPTADSTGKAELDVSIEVVTPADAAGAALTPYTAYNGLDFKAKDTIQLAGTSGTAVIAAGGINRTLSFGSTLAGSATTFVSANAADWLANTPSLVLTASTDKLIFEEAVAGNGFNGATIVNATTNLTGTVYKTK